jgi:outer membrane protein, heavy metal efflux system
VAELDAELDLRRAALFFLLGRQVDGEVETEPAPALVRVEDDLAVLTAQAEAVSPELRGLEAALERDRLAVSLARKEFRPDFMVQAGYSNRGRLDPMWQAGVSLSLPLRRKRLESGVAEAEARLRMDEQRVESVRRRLRYVTQHRAMQLRTAETVAHLYGGAIVPQGELAVEGAVGNYRTGRAPFTAALEALAALYVDRASHLRVLVALERVKVSLAETSLDTAEDVPMGSLSMPGGAARMDMGGAMDADAGRGAEPAMPAKEMP